MYLDNVKGYAADNFIVGQNKVGINMVNPQGFELYYNTIMTNSSIAAFQHVGNNTNGATVKRNIFHNGGTGYAMSMSNYNGFNSDENNWYTNGTNFSNNYSSFTIYQNSTNKDRNSANQLLTFKSATDPHLTLYNDFIHENSQLFGDPRTTEIEKYDFDGEWRQFSYYYGADNVEPKVRILNQPDAVIACSNGTTGDATFTVMATVSFGAQPTYQWQKDGKDISGANSAIHKILIADLDYNKSGTYRCLVGGTGGAVDVMSEEALLYVLTDPLITREPQPVIANAGETVMFEVQAHTYDYGVPVEKFSYQWYRGTLTTRW
jgi:hypothetical protein